MEFQCIEIEVGKGKSRHKCRAQIPSDSVLIAAATELREHGGLDTPAAGQYSDCIAIYVPPHEYSVRSMDVFAGELGPTVHRGSITEVCYIIHATGGPVALASYNNDRVSVLHFKTRCNPPAAGLFDEPDVLPLEGHSQTAETNVFEREPTLRRLCIEAHGTACAVCGFDFGARYGEDAQGFIHIHHLHPLASIRKAHVVNPITDLVPLCPNCHAVAHFRDPPNTPDEIRAMIAEANSSDN